MVGERAEILVNLQNDAPGSKLDLMVRNSGQSIGFRDGKRGSGRPSGSYLSARDFRRLHINVGHGTANPITALPDQLPDMRLTLQPA